ncbi:predicted protein [Sclerotinia sclerotiorum 1980 UF-70]|uniref:Uncharacterized protein n=1 Tax=Sclerotinia sclerotiorum (strain ATCC 18683 / 1980 / Ss-1) TaxID=665079 RepID=A7EJ59_SCLS1|nr:predicted protein [Sclerotinia sclerotiorum 1980 UF-70]EDO02875.1 predicted protein [Sclerotinia sclerotiorum 1980 UF-70]
MPQYYSRRILYPLPEHIHDPYGLESILDKFGYEVSWNTTTLTLHSVTLPKPKPTRRHRRSDSQGTEGRSFSTLFHLFPLFSLHNKAWELPVGDVWDFPLY